MRLKVELVYNLYVVKMHMRISYNLNTDKETRALPRKRKKFLFFSLIINDCKQSIMFRVKRSKN